MPCFHKFLGHDAHMAGENGLLPNWDADTLIIGTFNPIGEWVPNNLANYYYGRSKYFWSVLPKFACLEGIDKRDFHEQITFLQDKQIALTDLLISINDANIDMPDHVRRIRSFRDTDLNIFEEFNWNTQRIIHFINSNQIKEIYLTRAGRYNDIFDAQLLEIEVQTGRDIKRMHTPTGQGLGKGKPRENKLIHRWFEQGGNQFPFLCADFNINSPEFAWE